MRRTGALLTAGLVAGLVSISAACTGSEPAGSDPPAAARDVTDDESAGPSDAAAAPDAPTSSTTEGGAPGPDDLPLPGLLDTSDSVLPNDAAVRAGTLDNGLRYYVRGNDNPGGKAELRLAIDAGSVDEQGPSTGLAHFVEHMLFNGTERFPENELIATLRGFGAAFGADVNASTGYDSTVYQLTVPNADETVELGLAVLEQWLSHATIDEQQVVAERGVVLDEWRVRTQSVNGRLFTAAEPMFLGGTPYEGRSPIGTQASIEAMTAAELRDYYDRHYRPDAASIVVVGDVDVDEVEDRIARLFGPAVARSDEDPEPVEHRFTLDTEPDALVHADPDQQTVDVEITFPLGVVPSGSVAATRARLLDEIALQALLRRLDEDVTAGRAPFDDVAEGSNGYVRGLEARGPYAFTDVDRVADTVQALLDEYERARRFGFSQPEVDVAVESIRSSYRTRFDGRDSTQDRAYADAYVEDFLAGVGYPAIDDEYAAVTEILDGITTDAVDLRFRTLLANTAPHVIVSTPTAVADRIPSEAELLAMIAATAERALEPRDEAPELPDSLMAAPEAVDPTSVEAVVGAGDDLFDPVRLEFGNGVVVIVNRNDIVEGQVFLEGASPGGLSLVPDEDVVDALYATEVVTSSGLADFDAAAVDRILAGADVGFDAWLQPYSEHVGGVAASADLEVLLQIVHLALTAPRADEVALRQVISRYTPVVDDPSTDPGLVATDALLDARYPGEPRYAVLPEPDQFATLDLEGVRRVWASRFQNVDDWVFVLSGDLDPATAQDLVAAYLGTLPVGTPEEPVDVEDPPPPGVVRESRTAGTGDTASLTQLYTAPAGEVTPAVRALTDVTTELIAARLIDVVREELGDSYSPSAFTYLTFDPDPMIETYVSVTGAPERIDALADLVADEIASLVTAGASAPEYAAAFAQVEERYRFVDNGEFIRELLLDELEPAQDLEDYLLRSAALGSLEPADVDAFLRASVPVDRYIQVTVTPR